MDNSIYIKNLIDSICFCMTDSENSSEFFNQLPEKVKILFIKLAKKVIRNPDNFSSNAITRSLLFFESIRNQIAKYFENYVLYRNILESTVYAEYKTTRHIRSAIYHDNFIYSFEENNLKNFFIIKLDRDLNIIKTFQTKINTKSATNNRYSKLSNIFVFQPHTDNIFFTVGKIAYVCDMEKIKYKITVPVPDFNLDFNSEINSISFDHKGNIYLVYKYKKCLVYSPSGNLIDKDWSEFRKMSDEKKIFIESVIFYRGKTFFIASNKYIYYGNEQRLMPNGPFYQNENILYFCHTDISYSFDNSFKNSKNYRKMWYLDLNTMENINLANQFHFDGKICTDGNFVFLPDIMKKNIVKKRLF